MISTRVIIISIALVVGCVQRPTTSKYKQVDITGNLSISSIQQLLRDQEGRKPIDVIVVNSAGGNELAALQLAQYIHINQTMVVVDGACISACAHLLLPAAKTVKVTEGSIIALHTNVFGWLPPLKKLYPNYYKRQLKHARSQHQFLKSLNVDTKLLYCAHIAHEAVMTDPLHEPKPQIRTKYSMAPIGRKDIERFGVNITQFPTDYGNYDLDKIALSGTDLRGMLQDWSLDACDHLAGGEPDNWLEVLRSLE